MGGRSGSRLRSRPKNMWLINHRGDILVCEKEPSIVTGMRHTGWGDGLRPYEEVEPDGELDFCEREFREITGLVIPSGSVMKVKLSIEERPRKAKRKKESR